MARSDFLAYQYIVAIVEASLVAPMPKQRRVTIADINREFVLLK